MYKKYDKYDNPNDDPLAADIEVHIKGKGVNYWTTGSGERIKIKDMTDQHLINAINYLERKAKQMKINSYFLASRASEMFGEHTEAYWDAESAAAWLCPKTNSIAILIGQVGVLPKNTN